MPKGSNSGIYVMGEYEVQVLDSYGKMKVGNGDIGAIYGGYAPPVNASKAPGQWQQFVVKNRPCLPVQVAAQRRYHNFTYFILLNLHNRR